MENLSNTFAVGAPMTDPGVPFPKDWRLARASHVYLLLMGMPRVNLLLIGIDGGVWNVLETLLPDLAKPITSWFPGQLFALPSSARGGTIILHEVGALTHDDQRHLLDWLERADGRTQIVSTTSSPLLPRVHAGTFIDTLYYRLNTVCVDVTV
jgi:hypothetical protein